MLLLLLLANELKTELQVAAADSIKTRKVQETRKSSTRFRFHFIFHQQANKQQQQQAEIAFFYALCCPSIFFHSLMSFN